MKKFKIFIVILTLFIASSCVPTRKQNNFRIETAKVYLPLIQKQSDPFKGLAYIPNKNKDLDTLKIEWWYVWGPTGQIPMLREGLPDSKVPSNYSGYILVLNEPNVSIQTNISPKEAVIRLTDLRKAYPNAKLVCCGASVFAMQWMKDFWNMGGRPDEWHIHSYIEYWVTPKMAQSMISEMHKMTGGNYWITEYGSPAGKLNDFVAITEFFCDTPWITRIAAYTNKQPSNEWWSIGSGVNMIKDDGTMTEIGEYYSKLECRKIP